jgi:hypothetical protein
VTIQCINRTRQSRITGNGIKGIKPPDCGQFCNSPWTGALENVNINLESIQDQAFRESVQSRLRALNL